MFKGADDLFAYIRDEGVEFVDIRFCDLPGIMQHFTVPVGSFGPEVFEEGLSIPITKLYEEGRANEELMKILRGNVRAPDEVMGDLFAQVAGNEVGAHHLLAYLEEFDLPDLDDLSREILGRS